MAKDCVKPLKVLTPVAKPVDFVAKRTGVPFVKDGSVWYQILKLFTSAVV